MNSSTSSRDTSQIQNKDTPSEELDPLLSSCQSYYSSEIVRSRDSLRANDVKSSPIDNYHSAMSDHAEDNQQRFDLNERTASSNQSLSTLAAVNESRTDDMETGTISYELYADENNSLNRPISSARSIRSLTTENQSRTLSNSFSEGVHSATNRMHQYYDARANRIFSESSQRYLQDPLNDTRAEILAIRKSALTVYEPLTYVWLLFSVGFTLSAGLGMAKWNGLLANIQYWFVLLPCWLSHGLLLINHVRAVRALSTFISTANSNRQRTGSTDNTDRAEYLPLLQRSLKFGIKTGTFSLVFFVFEILLFLYLSKKNMSFGMVMLPLWIISVGGILYGITCKTQHFTMILSWVLFTCFMVLIVLKVDHGVYSLSLNMVFSPLVGFMCMSMLSLSYILYGHHIRFFTLTMAQYRAGMLYFTSLICGILLLVLLLSYNFEQPDSIEVQFLMIVLTCLTVALLSLGAYSVSHDELERLFKYGGQVVVHPKKLRFERHGWNAVDSKGVMLVPMFGEVRYEPLDPNVNNICFDMCSCCWACYPYDDDVGVYIDADTRFESHR